MLKQIRELFLTNLLNVGTFLFIGISQLKDVIELVLFITLIFYNIGKIKQLIKTQKEKKTNETQDEA